MKIKNCLKPILLLALLCMAANTTNAQDFEDNEDVPDTVPLDGGLSLLAAGGIAYGAKKWHELKNKPSK